MQSNNLIEVNGLNKVFQRKSGHLFRRKTQKVYALNDLSFSIKKGEILGVIGESGCGKTTLARTVMRLLKESNGNISFNGTEMTDLNERQTRDIRKKMQMIFQDPYDTLNPGMRVLDILMEPLNAHEKKTSYQHKIDRVNKALENIDLKPVKDYLYRYPHELSGGQRQRIAVARAIILEPDFVAADEPTSMLDVSVRAGILNLLLNLKDKMGLTMMFITHDLATASYMCDRIAVMYQGEIVEIAPTRQIIEQPSHPYTKALVAVVKDLNTFIERRETIILDGEADAAQEQVGCPFTARCPHVHNTCDTIKPKLLKVNSGHYAACHLENAPNEADHIEEYAVR